MILTLTGLFSVFSLVLRLVCYLVIKDLVVLCIMSEIDQSVSFWQKLISNAETGALLLDLAKSKN